MNRSDAANIAQQARRTAAARKRGARAADRQLDCEHANTHTEPNSIDGLDHIICTDCGAWRGTR